DTIIINAVADGYGTILTPTSIRPKSANPLASNNALRVKTKTTTSYGGSFAITAYSFDWWTKANYSAHVSTNENLKPYGISYTISENNAVQEEAEEPMDIRLSANPVIERETILS